MRIYTDSFMTEQKLGKHLRPPDFLKGVGDQTEDCMVLCAFSTFKHSTEFSLTFSLCTCFVFKMQLPNAGVSMPYSVAFKEQIYHLSKSTIKAENIPGKLFSF